MKPSMSEPVQPDWRIAAACRSADRRAFFRMEREHVAAWEVRRGEAFAVCAVCTVREQCWDDAVKSGEQFGVRAGQDLEAPFHERRRQRALRRAGVPA